MVVDRFRGREGIFWPICPASYYLKFEAHTRPSGEGEAQNSLVRGWTSEEGLEAR